MKTLITSLKTWSRIATLGFGFFLFSMASAMAEAFVISKDKVCKISLTDVHSMDENRAAKELMKYFKRLKAFKFEIAAPGSKDASIVLGSRAISDGVVKAEELKGLKFGSYIIRTKGDKVYIAGDKYGGVVYGVYGLFEKIGMKIYSGVNVEVATPDLSKGLVVPEINVTSVPFFEHRMTGGIRKSRPYMGKVDDPELQKKVGYMSYWHTTSYLVPFPKYYKTNPEYFATFKNGDRAADVFADRFTTMIHRCLSNKEVREIAKKRLKKWMDKQDERFVFDVSHSDDFQFCYCENCKKLDTVPGKVLTNRAIDWCNEIARDAAKHSPGKVITGVAYTRFTAIPPREGTKLEPNLKLWLAAYTPEVGAQNRWFDHKANTTFGKWYKEWVKRYPGKLYMYDYATGYVFLHDHMFQRLKRYAKDGIKGIYFCGTPRHIFRDLFYYVTDELTWNPDQDIQSLVDDFITHYYGPAAKEMSQIYAFLKRISEKEGRIQGVYADIKNFMTLEEHKELMELYGRAQSKTSEGSRFAYRVNFDKANMLQLFLEAYNIGRRNIEDVTYFKNTLSDFLRLGGGNYIKNKLKRKPKSVQGWMWNVARLKVDMKDFWKDPAIVSLVNFPEKVKIEKLPKIELENLGYGWKIPLEMFDGAYGIVSYKWRCPRRKGMNLRSRNIARAHFELEKDIKGAALVIEGQDDDKSGTTPIRVAVNGTEVFRGANPFQEEGWSTKMWFLPQNTLKSGKNEVVIHNLSEETNPFRGWAMISGVWLEKRMPR